MITPIWSQHRHLLPCPHCRTHVPLQLCDLFEGIARCESCGLPVRLAHDELVLRRSLAGYEAVFARGRGEGIELLSV